jgi:hypothetical protein
MTQWQFEEFCKALEEIVQLENSGAGGVGDV